MLTDEQRRALVAVMAPINAKPGVRSDEETVITGARFLMERYDFDQEEAHEAALETALEEFPTR